MAKEIEQEEDKSFIEEAQETVKHYLGNRLLLAKMEAAEKTSILAGKLTFMLAAALLFFFMLLFISLMAGYYLSHIFDSQLIGFAIISGFYLLLFILLITVGKNFIYKTVGNNIITTFFKDEDPDDVDDEEDDEESIEVLTRRLKQKLEKNG